ncbi:lysozyme [Aurantiacibacter hainanensis]|uniref:lysozyme n=1 Tax=Aurantiacibacter hainanensis TaxID=3076114 RepID=UPI0030C67F46
MRTERSKASKEIEPAVSWMRGQMVREFVRRLRRKHRGETGQSLRGRMRKRKTALAMSAAVMGFSTGAVDISKHDPAYKITMKQMDPTKERVHAGMLKVSDTMKEALAEEEGVRLTVYRDVAGYPTVGVGHLLTPEDGLSVGDRITYDQAIEFLEQDLKKAEEGVKRLVGDLPIFQHEFDALVDLVYNVGEGNVSPDQSPRLNDAIVQSDYDGIARELEYTTAAGKVARGLEYRSERRQSIFMEASYEDPRALEVDINGQARI